MTKNADVYPGLTVAVEKLGLCTCGHEAISHWHGGKPEAPSVKGCGFCECKRFAPDARAETQARMNRSAAVEKAERAVIHAAEAWRDAGSDPKKRMAAMDALHDSVDALREARK